MQEAEVTREEGRCQGRERDCKGHTARGRVGGGRGDLESLEPQEGGRGTGKDKAKFFLFLRGEGADKSRKKQNPNGMARVCGSAGACSMCPAAVSELKGERWRPLRPRGPLSARPPRTLRSFLLGRGRVTGAARWETPKSSRREEAGNKGARRWAGRGAGKGPAPPREAGRAAEGRTADGCRPG